MNVLEKPPRTGPHADAIARLELLLEEAETNVRIQVEDDTNLTKRLEALRKAQHTWRNIADSLRASIRLLREAST